MALLKYTDVIRKAQITYGGYAWIHYDEEFRARVSEDAKGQWGELDTDLYMHTMKSELPKTTFTASGLPIVYRPFRGQPTQAGVGSGGRGQLPVGGEGLAGHSTKASAHRTIASFGMNARNAEAGIPWSSAGDQGGWRQQQQHRGGRGASGPSAKGAYSG